MVDRHQSRFVRSCTRKIAGLPLCLTKLNKVKGLKPHKNAQRIDLELAQSDDLDLIGIVMGF
jgi:hypothetical protein